MRHSKDESQSHAIGQSLSDPHPTLTQKMRAIEEQQPLEPKDAAEWLETYGSPLFVFDTALFRSRLRMIREAARDAGLETGLYYSYKTNSISEICRVAHEEGFGAEVVSASELDHALRLGVRGPDIIYNGPLKSERSIRMALENGALVHADSIEEIGVLHRIASEGTGSTRYGVRVQLTQGTAPWTKFGVTANELVDFLRGSRPSSGRRLAGLHVHLGTNITDPSVYSQAVQRLVEVARQIEDQLSAPLDYLDLGGGWAASDAVPLDLLPGDWEVPAPLAYAKAISGALESAGRKDLRVLLEPGRVVVAPCMKMLFRVTSVKRHPHTMAITDGNINSVPSAYYLRHPLTSLAPTSRPLARTDVFGPLCTQFDSLRLDTDLPDPQPGDILVLHEVGAYTITFSNQFAHPRPPVLAIDGDRAPRLIRRREADDAFWRDDL